MEISTEIIKEADVLVVSLIMGMVLMLVYDQIRIFRRLIPHGTMWVGIEDILFWIASAVALFAMRYRENSGYIRGFAIGGGGGWKRILNLLVKGAGVRGVGFLFW